MARRIAALCLAVGLLTPAALRAQQSSTAAPQAQSELSAPPPPAQQLVDEGLATARAQEKNVLVYFTASWCGWCHRFQTMLEDPVIGPLMAKYFVPVRLTVQERGDKEPLNNPGSAELLKKMGSTGGIPFYFMLDASGKKLGDANGMPDGSNIGHPYTDEEVKAFEGVLARTAPRMSAAERTQVGTYLTRVAKASSTG